MLEIATNTGRDITLGDSDISGLASRLSGELYDPDNLFRLGTSVG
jgi:hypothetical protein